MEKLRKKLSDKADRPVFEINAQNGDKRIRCLFDTGADIPVFTLGREMLLMYFPDAVLCEDYYAAISGFGKSEEQAFIYNIPDFIIKSDTDQDYIQFNNLFLACIDKENIKYPLILSATMFKHMNYYVDNLREGNKQLTIYHNRVMYGTGINSVDNKGKRSVIKYNSYYNK
ncbi:MAG: hypothetical protein K2N90_02050 [Lachnospiraceae bacterium]|nr:hypothetical protein [Lachnospiraceae bacterium]